jgi:hypothetical protein
MLQHLRGSQLFIKSTDCLNLDIPLREKLLLAVQEICNANIDTDIPPQMKDEFNQFQQRVTAVKDDEKKGYIPTTIASFSEKELKETHDELLRLNKRFCAITER